MLFTSGVNDSFISKQQCGYNSTPPHNVYDYFQWRKDLGAFCTSFDLALKCFVQSSVADSRFTSVAFRLDFNIYFLYPYLSGLIIVFSMFKY